MASARASVLPPGWSARAPISAVWQPTGWRPVSARCVETLANAMPAFGMWPSRAPCAPARTRCASDHFARWRRALQECEFNSPLPSTSATLFMPKVPRAAFHPQVVEYHLRVLAALQFDHGRIPTVGFARIGEPSIFSRGTGSPSFIRGWPCGPGTSCRAHGNANALSGSRNGARAHHPLPRPVDYPLDALDTVDDACVGKQARATSITLEPMSGPWQPGSVRHLERLCGGMWSPCLPRCPRSRSPASWERASAA